MADSQVEIPIPEQTQTLSEALAKNLKLHITMENWARQSLIIPDR